MMRSGGLLLVLGLVFSTSAGGCSNPWATQKASTKLANPASVHCGEVGGTLELEKTLDGGTLGICYFDSGGQCEEWALFRKECPVGGVKISKTTSPAQRSCVIRGGSFELVTPASDSHRADGLCNLPDGEICGSAFVKGVPCPILMK
ncbi:MAG: DUF333 domain-containing protein [Myxococcota bacterium]|nr:DUF333 domain-containing protein [Myxococcota bacterium]